MMADFMIACGPPCPDCGRNPIHSYIDCETCDEIVQQTKELFREFEDREADPEELDKAQDRYERGMGL